MKKKIRLLLSVLPLVITIIVLFFLPDNIPSHYDIYGNVDGRGSKYLLLIMPVFIYLTHLGTNIVISKMKKGITEDDSDKKTQHIKNNISLINNTSILLILILDFMCFYFIILAWNNSSVLSIGNIDFYTLMTFLISILTIALAKITMKSKPNAVIGLRTSWSMYNENTWEVSNYYTGIILIIAGFLSILSAIVLRGLTSQILMVVFLVLAAIISCVISYRVYREAKSKE